MIALNRIRTAKAIHAKFKGADKRDRDKELMFTKRKSLIDPVNKIEFKSAYWKTAKTQLRKESNGKCAYCEANTQVVAHGDVEHYRPKDLYWWLAYTYDNYLYACQVCNQTYKNNNFPISAVKHPEPVITENTSDADIQQLAGNISPDPIDTTIGYTFQSYLFHHSAEEAYLINPYLSNPVIYFAYEADDTVEEVKVVPAKLKYAAHIKAAESFYGINRIELKNARYEIFRNFRLFKKSYANLTDEPTRKEVKNQINSMLSDKYVFAGMNRYFDNKL